MDYSLDEIPSTEGIPCPDYEVSEANEGLSRGDSTNMNSAVPDQPSSIDEISNKLEDLVERINTIRTSDQTVMDSFQEKITTKMTELFQLFQQLKDHMYTVYEDNSNDMQVKLRELTEVLNNCSQLNQELLDANQALSSLKDSL